MQEIIKQVKADLRSMMNGVAAAAMRQAGLTADYRVNFGVEIPRLQTLAGELCTEYPDCLPALSQALWHESVRECRILATLLMPADTFADDVADIWADEIHTVELAQIAAMNLFSKMPSATTAAFRWIASGTEIRQTLGYYTMLHLMRQAQLSPRSKDELADQAAAALQADNSQLRMAAQRVLDRLDK